MRIELNAGGLGRSTVNDFQDHLNRLISEAQNNADAFGTVKNAIYNLNGGVANMQHAMDLLQARETHEQDRKDYLQAVANQYNDFLNLAFRQDDQAAGLFSHVPANWVPIQIGIDIILPTWDPSSYQGKAIDILTGEESDSQGEQGLLSSITNSLKSWFEKVLGILFPEPLTYNYDDVYIPGSTEYYGGNQMVFEFYADANDEQNLASLREIYDRNNPGNNLTDEEFKEYLRILTSEGCGYVAMANTMLMYYTQHPEEWPFEYPMYDENGNLNYQALTMDIYSRLDDPTRSGTNEEERKRFMEQFLSDHGQDVRINTQVNVTPENFNQLVADGKQVIVSFHDGYMYDTNGNAIMIDGGHAMTVTGVTDDGRLIVSSWGEQYYIDPSRTGTSVNYNGEVLTQDMWFSTIEYR